MRISGTPASFLNAIFQMTDLISKPYLANEKNPDDEHRRHQEQMSPRVEWSREKHKREHADDDCKLDHKST